jgi:cytoskeletal protein RodZ
VQDTKKPTIKAVSKTLCKTHFKNCREKIMTLLILEALLALLILIGIVWWTMFSGRTKGEIRTDQNKNSEQE